MEPYRHVSVALERDTQKREQEWLLKNKMPTYLDELRQKIESCIRFINPVICSAAEHDQSSQNKGGGEGNKELVRLKVSDNLKGYLKIDGWNITESQLMVRFPKFNKGISYAISSSNTQPWKLHQIQNVHEFLHMALSHIDMPDPVSATRIMKCIDEVVHCLKQALSEMETEYSSIGSTNETFFSSIPENLHVCFSVLNTSYVVSVYLLRPQKHSRAFDPSHRRQAYEEGVSGSRALDANFPEVVADSAQCAQPSKKLERCLVNIHGILELCLEIREKLIVVSQVN
ncbi:protein rogdi-like [Schistocerca gregaria]|uniref:protein rogdi-like n=1 Tax=Schistocerca gregaria TaxID=7010 RepID=UPI00211EA0CC|nr:protein rogdi-like [Schistocerca gregaria]